MSVLTASPLLTAPSAGAGLTLTTGTSWAWGPWVQVLAATTAPTAIAGVSLAGGSYSNLFWDLDMGTGASGSEASIGTWRIFLYNSGASGGPVGLMLPLPLGGIPTGARVSIRARTTAITTTPTITLMYYQNLNSDQASNSTQVLGSSPAGSATTITITPNATAWATSAWVELITSAASPLGILGLVHGAATGATAGIEYDLGTGASGSEVVLTTLRETTPYGTILYSWLPGISPIAAGTRLAIRLRKSDTSTTAHPVAVLYYTNMGPTS